jgi:hypothetical protein
MDHTLFKEARLLSDLLVSRARRLLPYSRPAPCRLHNFTLELTCEEGDRPLGKDTIRSPSKQGFRINSVGGMRAAGRPASGGSRLQRNQYTGD